MQKKAPGGHLINKAEGGLIQGFQEGGMPEQVQPGPGIKQSEWWRRYEEHRRNAPVDAQGLQWTGFHEGQEEFDRTGVRPTQSPYGDFPRLRLAKPNDDPARRSGEWYVEPGWKPIAGVNAPRCPKTQHGKKSFLHLSHIWIKTAIGRRRRAGLCLKEPAPCKATLRKK